MADKKISQLTAGSTPLTGTEELPVIQGGETVKVTTQDIADLAGGGLPYKVYTALLTQSGEDFWINNSTDGPEPFIIGVTYYIDENNDPSADFTNIGAPNNNVGTYFVATGTTPNSWGNGLYVNLRYNTGAPVVTVLENTIGNVYWEYIVPGVYIGYLPDDLLTEKKQVVFSKDSSLSISTSQTYIQVSNNAVDGEVSITVSNGSIFVNIGIVDYPIEIRVYN